MTGIGPSGEEINSWMNSQMDRQRMAQESYIHSVERLFTDLSQDALESLLGLLINIINDVDGSEQVAGYALGRINGELLRRFKVCPACHKNHEAEAKQMMTAEKPASTESKDSAEPTLFDKEGNPTPEAVADDEYDQSRILSLFQQYSLKPITRNDDEPVSDQTRGECMGCGMIYLTLADRMLRPTGIDGCHGCQQRSAHG